MDSIVCGHCGRDEHFYSYTTTVDGVKLCGKCSRYLFDLAKSVTKPYSYYRQLDDKEKLVQQKKEEYLSAIRKLTQFKAGEKNATDDQLRTEIKGKL